VAPRFRGAYDAGYEGLVWSAIVLSLLALTGLAQIPNPVAVILALCRRGRKGEADYRRSQEFPDRQIRTTTALREFYQSYSRRTRN
jgi:hypothetical protein